VKGYGNVKVWTILNGLKKPAVIKKVLYVPELGTNLFSISAATRLGWEVIFSDTTVRISSAKHEVIMVGERAGRGLYLLKIHPRRSIHEDHDKQLGFTPPIKNRIPRLPS
jgi:hypothetical protein